MMSTMTEEEQRLSRVATAYVRDHKRELIERFASLEHYLPDNRPVSIFMAGSPGAGKTEFSKRLMESFESQPVRIDADEIREWIPDRHSNDASVFQKACTDGVQKLYDHVLHKRLNVILDGTFAYAKVTENVGRSLKHRRKVEIYFLYQDPLLSWKFTKDREKEEHRNVPKDTFINAFFASQDNVDQVKQQFGKDVELNVVIKNFDKDLESLNLNVEKVESHLPKRYTKEELEAALQ